MIIKEDTINTDYVALENCMNINNSYEEFKNSIFLTLNITFIKTHMHRRLRMLLF